MEIAGPDAPNVELTTRLNCSAGWYRTRAACSRVAWPEVIVRDYESLVAQDEASPYEAEPTCRRLMVKQRAWTEQVDRWQRRIGARP